MEVEGRRRLLNALTSVLGEMKEAGLRLPMPKKMVTMTPPSTTSSSTRNTSLHSFSFPPLARSSVVEDRRRLLYERCSPSSTWKSLATP